MNQIPTTEETNRAIEKADSQWCESFECYEHIISISKKNKGFKVNSMEQNSTSKKRNVVEMEANK